MTQAGKMGKGASGRRAHWPGWKAFPWFILPLSLFPTLALLANNITEVSPSVALVPCLLSIAAALILLGILVLLFHDWTRAGLAASIFLILFFLYGHVYSYLKGMTVIDFFAFRHRTLAPLFLVLAVLGYLWVRSLKGDLFNLARILTVSSLVLLVMPVVQIGAGVYKQQKAWLEASGTAPQPAANSSVAPAQNDPDIYYIILDGYTRSDVIQRLYGYDNSGFLQSLQQAGFYVASCAQSNYAQTELSLASSLNFDYLDSLNPALVSGNTDRSPLWPLIKHSAIRRFLESRGYKTIAFATGYNWTEINDADYYFAPQAGAWELNPFQYMLLQTTAGRILLDAESLGSATTPDDLSRRRSSNVLDRLPALPAIPGPKFIFAHILVPHSFVFGPNGEPILVDWNTGDPGVFNQGYVDQLMYLARVMPPIVDTIISQSKTPPIIIIQGDHGVTRSTRADRVSILNAYYLPGHEDLLYTTITPVNTFRIILNVYFGQNLPLRPDESGYSTYQDPYDYYKIPNECSK